MVVDAGMVLDAGLSDNVDAASVVSSSSLLPFRYASQRQFDRIESFPSALSSSQAAPRWRRCESRRFPLSFHAILSSLVSRLKVAGEEKEEDVKKESGGPSTFCVFYSLTDDKQLPAPGPHSVLHLRIIRR